MRSGASAACIGPACAAAHDWLNQYRGFWEASLDRLADYLEQAPAPAQPPKGKP